VGNGCAGRRGSGIIWALKRVPRTVALTPFYLVRGNIVSSLKIAKKAKPLSRAHSESAEEPDLGCAPLDG